jgi:polyferredoxin
MQKSQLVMVWLLPIILIGGLFYPLIGYLVAAMMAFFLPLSLFKGRFWCRRLCPRGAFLDIVLSKVSANKPLPKIFLKQWFRWLIFILFISFLIFRIIKSGGNLIIVGSIFVSMCLLTTAISVIIGLFKKHRGWCAICPMGTIQDKLARINPK